MKKRMLPLERNNEKYFVEYEHDNIIGVDYFHFYKEVKFLNIKYKRFLFEEAICVLSHKFENKLDKHEPEFLIYLAEYALDNYLNENEKYDKRRKEKNVQVSYFTKYCNK